MSALQTGLTIKKIHVIVHPMDFGKPLATTLCVKGKNYVFEHKTPEQELFEKWRKSVREVADDPNAIMVFVPLESDIKHFKAKKSNDLIELMKEAKKTLGERAFFLKGVTGMSLPQYEAAPRLEILRFGDRYTASVNKIKARKLRDYLEKVKSLFNARGVKVHEEAEIEGYGIYAHLCVTDAVENIGWLLGIPPERQKINLEKSVNSWA